MRPIVKTIDSITDDDNGIAESQSLGGAGSLTLDGALVSGGVATIGEAQQVVVTSAGDDSGIDWTVTGTDADGNPYTETFDGANAGAATSTGHFKTVTDISADGATAGNVTAGVDEANGAVSQTIRVNSDQSSSFKLSLSVEYISATATCTVQHSPDWPESGDFIADGYSNNANWYSTDGLSAITATNEGNIAFSEQCVRLNITSYTSGSVKLTVGQNY